MRCLSNRQKEPSNDPRNEVPLSAANLSQSRGEDRSRIAIISIADDTITAGKVGVLLKTGTMTLTTGAWLPIAVSWLSSIGRHRPSWRMTMPSQKGWLSFRYSVEDDIVTDP